MGGDAVVADRHQDVPGQLMLNVQKPLVGVDGLLEDGNRRICSASAAAVGIKIQHGIVVNVVESKPLLYGRDGDRVLVFSSKVVRIYIVI